jgi:hypothetical protein
VTVETIPPNTPVTLVSMRTAILGNGRPAKITYAQPLEVRRLCRDGDVLMSDHPQEMMDHAPFLALARGRVLVTGLGLGYVVAQLLRRPAVTAVVVVDHDAEIIELIGPQFRGQPVSIIHDDACAVLAGAAPGHFQSAWLDTWFRTSEYTFMTEIVPQCRLARRARIPHVDYWGRPDVEGQLSTAMLFHEQFDADGWPPRAVLRHALMHRALRRPVDHADAQELARVLARPFLAPWERLFGAAWDAAVLAHEKTTAHADVA